MGGQLAAAEAWWCSKQRCSCTTAGGAAVSMRLGRVPHPDDGPAHEWCTAADATLQMWNPSINTYATVRVLTAVEEASFHKYRGLGFPVEHLPHAIKTRYSLSDVVPPQVCDAPQDLGAMSQSVRIWAGEQSSDAEDMRYDKPGLLIACVQEGGPDDRPASNGAWWTGLLCEAIADDTW
jgi:hypothetical protein